jgi:hypothetical protein
MIAQRFPLFFLLLYLAIVSGCSTVRLISEYDQVIDQGVTALQTRTEDQLSRLETGLRKMALYKDGTKEKADLQAQVAYGASEEFYRNFRVDLRVLKARAEIYEKNDLTVKQFEALEEILNAQIDIHQRGFSSAEDVVDMRNAFTRGFKGILKLEIAKKRGAK